jgi:hypothetical protein
MTCRADEMKVPRMTIRGLEPGTPFAEVDLAGDAGGDHPLQRAIERGTADARILAANELEQLVRAQMALLAQEDVQNLVALGRPLTARGTQRGKIGERAVCSQMTNFNLPRMTVRTRKWTSRSGS